MPRGKLHPRGQLNRTSKKQQEERMNEDTTTNDHSSDIDPSELIASLAINNTALRNTAENELTTVIERHCPLMELLLKIIQIPSVYTLAYLKTNLDQDCDLICRFILILRSNRNNQQILAILLKSLAGLTSRTRTLWKFIEEMSEMNGGTDSMPSTSHPISHEITHHAELKALFLEARLQEVEIVAKAFALIPKLQSQEQERLFSALLDFSLAVRNGDKTVAMCTSRRISALQQLLIDTFESAFIYLKSINPKQQLIIVMLLLQIILQTSIDDSLYQIGHSALTLDRKMKLLRFAARLTPNISDRDMKNRLAKLLTGVTGIINRETSYSEGSRLRNLIQSFKT